MPQDGTFTSLLNNATAAGPPTKKRKRPMSITPTQKPSPSGVSQDPNDLEQTVRDKFNQLQELYKQQGKSLKIRETYRPSEVQDRYYSQGRTTPGKIITHAKGGQSDHQYGQAVDVDPSDGDYQNLGRLAKQVGLKWGGDWTNFKDWGHVYLDQSRKQGKPMGPAGGPFGQMLRKLPQTPAGPGPFQQLLQKATGGPSTDEGDVVNGSMSPTQPSGPLGTQNQVPSPTQPAVGSPPIGQQQTKPAGSATVPISNVTVQKQGEGDDQVLWNRDIHFVDKPDDVTNTEWAIRQLVPEIANKTGLDPVDIEDQLKKGFIHQWGTPIEDIDKDHFYRFGATPGFIQAVQDLHDQKESALERALEDPDPKTPEDWQYFADQIHLDPNLVRNASEGRIPRYNEYYQAGLKRQQQMLQMTDQIMQQEGVQNDFVARVMAKQRMGLIDVGQAVKAVQDENNAEQEAQETFRNGFSDWMGVLKAGLVGVSEAGSAGGPITSLAMMSPEAVEDRRQTYTRLQMLNAKTQFGNYTNWKKENDRINQEYGPQMTLPGTNIVVGRKYRPLALPIEAAKSFYRAAPEALSAIARAEAQVEDLVDYTDPYRIITGGEVKPIDQRAGVKVAKVLENWTKETFKANPDIANDNTFLTDTIPNTVGQLLIQMGTGVISGGATAPTLLGASQGMAQQQEAAIKGGATPNQERVVALTSALAAVPDAIPFAMWLKPLSAADRGTWFSKFLGKIFTTAEEVGGQEFAQQATKGALKKMLENLAGKSKVLGASALFEGMQELSENKIDDAVAKATYDPNRKVLTINDDDVASTLGGFIGGLVGGGFEIRIEGAQHAAEQNYQNSQAFRDILDEFGRNTANAPTEQQPTVPNPNEAPQLPTETPLGPGSKVMTPSGEGQIVNKTNKGWVVDYNPRQTKTGETSYQSRKEFRANQVTQAGVSETPTAIAPQLEEKGFQMVGEPRQRGVGPAALKEQRDIARREADTDQLTGIANRRALDRALPTAESDPNTSIISFDANNFGKVNKQLGEKAGDQALVELSQALAEAAAESNTSARVFRRGGDEFVMIAPKETAEKIKNRAQEIYGVRQYGDTNVSLTGNVGENFDTANEGLQQAKSKYKQEVEQMAARFPNRPKQSTVKVAPFTGTGGKNSRAPEVEAATGGSLKRVFKDYTEQAKYFRTRQILKDALHKAGLETHGPAELEDLYNEIQHSVYLIYGSRDPSFSEFERAAKTKISNYVRDVNQMGLDPDEMTDRLVRPRELTVEEQRKIPEIIHEFNQTLLSKRLQVDPEGDYTMADFVRQLLRSQVIPNTDTVKNLLMQQGMTADQAENEVLKTMVSGFIDSQPRMFKPIPAPKQEAFTKIFERGVIGPTRQLRAPLTYRPQFTVTAMMDPAFQQARLKNKPVSLTFIKETAYKSAKGRPLEKSVIDETLSSPTFDGRKKVMMAEFDRELSMHLMPMNIIHTTTHNDYGAGNLGISLPVYETHILAVTGMDHGYFAHWPGRFIEDISNMQFEVMSIPDETGNLVHLVVPDVQARERYVHSLYGKAQFHKAGPGQSSDTATPLSNEERKAKFREITDSDLLAMAVHITTDQADAYSVAADWSAMQKRNMGLLSHGRTGYDLANKIAYTLETQGEGLQRFTYEYRKAVLPIPVNYKYDRGRNEFTIARSAEQTKMSLAVSSAVVMVFNHFDRAQQQMGYTPAETDMPMVELVMQINDNKGDIERVLNELYNEGEDDYIQFYNGHSPASKMLEVVDKFRNNYFYETYSRRLQTETTKATTEAEEKLRQKGETRSLTRPEMTAIQAMVGGKIAKEMGVRKVYGEILDYRMQRLEDEIRQKEEMQMDISHALSEPSTDKYINHGINQLIERMKKAQDTKVAAEGFHNELRDLQRQGLATEAFNDYYDAQEAGDEMTRNDPMGMYHPVLEYNDENGRRQYVALPRTIYDDVVDHASDTKWLITYNMIENALSTNMSLMTQEVSEIVDELSQRFNDEFRTQAGFSFNSTHQILHQAFKDTFKPDDLNEMLRQGQDPQVLEAKLKDVYDNAYKIVDSWTGAPTAMRNEYDAIKQARESPNYNQYLDLIEEQHEMWQKIPNIAPLWARQFIYHQKNFAHIVMRHELRLAAQRGMTTYRMAAPETAELGEGHVSRDVIKKAQYVGMPYEIMGVRGNDNRQNYLGPKSSIVVVDKTDGMRYEWQVVEANDETFIAAQDRYIQEMSPVDAIILFSDQPPSGIRETDKETAKQLLQQNGYRIISDEGLGYGHFMVVDPAHYDKVAEFQQPTEFLKTQPDMDAIRRNMSYDYHGLFNRYMDLEKQFFKERPDARIYVDEQGNRWLETTLTDEDKVKPMLMFKADLNEEHQSDRHELAAREEFGPDFFEKIHSTVDDTGSIKLNFEAAELIRRIESQSKLNGGVDPDTPIFDAAFARQNEMDVYIPALESTIAEMKQAGYPDEYTKPIEMLRDQLLNSEGHAVLYARDHALSHEKIHEARYLRSALQESIQSYYKDFDKTFEAAKTDDGSKSVNEKAFNNYFRKVYFNNRPFNSLTAEERAILHEETFTAIADGDYAKLKLTDGEAARFFKSDIDAYVEKHGPDVLNDLETWINEKTAKFGVIEKIRSDLKSKAEFENAGYSVQDSEAIGPAESYREGSEGDQAEGGVETRVKDRSLPKTVSERTTLNEDDLTERAKSYEPLSRATTQSEADYWVKSQGFESAYAQVFDMPPSAQTTAKRMAVIEHIDGQIEKYYLSGDDRRAREWHSRLVALTNALSPQYTEYGRAIGQLARWSDYDPTSIVGEVHRQVIKAGQTGEISLKTQQQLRDQAKTIQQLEKKNKQLQEKLAGNKTPREKTIAVQRSAAQTAMAKLKSVLGTVKNFNGSLKAAADKIRRINATGSAASWINRNEAAVSDWQKIFNSNDPIGELANYVNERTNAPSMLSDTVEAGKNDLSGYLDDQINLVDQGIVLANPQIMQMVRYAKTNKKAALDQMHLWLKTERQTSLSEWSNYLNFENPIYSEDPFFKDFVWKDVANLRSDRPDLPPSLDRAALAAVYERYDQGNNFSAFSKIYKEEVSRALAEDTNVTSINVEGGRWIKIPKTEPGHADFDRNTSRLRSLSANSWCTSRGMERTYLPRGDFWIYQDNGSTELAIRFEGDAVAEIQGRLNNGRIPIEYLDQVTALQNSGEVNFNKQAQKQIDAAKQQVVESEKINDWISKEKITGAPEMMAKIKNARSLTEARGIYEWNTNRDQFIKDNKDVITSREMAALKNYMQSPGDERDNAYFEWQQRTAEHYFSTLMAKVAVRKNFDSMTEQQQYDTLGLTTEPDGTLAFHHSVSIGEDGRLGRMLMQKVDGPVTNMSLAKFLPRISRFSKSVQLKGAIDLPNLRVGERNVGIESVKVKVPNLKVVGGHLYVAKNYKGTFDNLTAVGGGIYYQNNDYTEEWELKFPKLIRMGPQGFHFPGLIIKAEKSTNARTNWVMRMRYLDLDGKEKPYVPMPQIKARGVMSIGKEDINRYLLMKAGDENDKPISEFNSEVRDALISVAEYKYLEGRLAGGQSFNDWQSSVNNELAAGGVDPSQINGYHKSLYREMLRRRRNEHLQLELDRVKEKYGLQNYQQARFALVEEKEVQAKKVRLAAEAERAAQPTKDKRTAVQIAIDNQIEASDSDLTREDVLAVKDRNKFFMDRAGKMSPREIQQQYVQAVNLYVDATNDLKEARQQLQAERAVRAPGYQPNLSPEEVTQIKQELDEVKKQKIKASNDLRKFIDYLVKRPEGTKEQLKDWYRRINRGGEAFLTATLQTAMHNVIAQRATKAINAVETAVELGFAKAEAMLGTKLFAEADTDIPSETKFRDVFKNEITQAGLKPMKAALDAWRNDEAGILGAIQTMAAYKANVVEGALAYNPDLYDKMLGNFSYGDDGTAGQKEINPQYGTAKRGIEKGVRAFEKVVHWGTVMNRVQEKHFRYSTFMGTLMADLKGKGYDLDKMMQEGDTREIPRQLLDRAVTRALEDTFGADFPSGGNLDRWVKATSDVASWIPFPLNPMLFRRFFYNSNKFMIEHSPLVLGKIATSGFTKRDMAKGVMGIGMFLFALQLLRAFRSDDDDPTVLRVPTPWGPKNIRMSAYNPISNFLVAASLVDRHMRGKSYLKTGYEVPQFFGIDTRYPNLAVDWWVSLARLGGYDTDRYAKFGQNTKIVGARGLTTFVRPLATMKDIIAQFDDEEAVMRENYDYPFYAEVAKGVPFLGRNLPAREDVMTQRPFKKESPLLNQLGVTFVNDNQVGAKFSPAEEYLDQASQESRSQEPKSFKTAEERRASATLGQLYTQIDKGNDVKDAATAAKQRGLINKKQLDQILAANKIKSTIERKARDSSIVKITEAWWLANDAEREILLKVLKEKIAKQKHGRSYTEGEKRAVAPILGQ